MEEMIAQPQAESSQEVQETQSEQPTQQESSTQSLPSVKVKYNRKEMEMPYDQAVEYVQKGMNYDKVYEKYQVLNSDPRLTFVDEIAKQYGMDTNSYMEAVKQSLEQERLNNLVEQNIPEDIAREILENRQFRQQWESEQRSKQEEQKKQAEYQDFIATFPNVNPQEIPPNVWEEVAKGKNLVDAYIRHENNLLKQQLETVQKTNEAKQANVKNAETSPVGTTGNGVSESGHLTKQQVESNKNNKKWMMDNIDRINESMKHW